MTDFLSKFFEVLFSVLAYSILVRAILSWFPESQRYQVVVWLHQITDPVLNPLRRIIPPIAGTIDISPMIAFLVLILAAQYAASLR